MQRTNFFVILDHIFPFYPPKNPKNQLWKTEKKAWKYCHFTHVYHKWQSNNVWFLRYWVQQIDFFVILNHFLPFNPPNNPKYQNFEKLKKHLEILSFYTYVHKLQSYDVWFLRYQAQRTECFVILDNFLPIYPLDTQKIKILKKWKKCLEILFYTSVPKIMIIC